ncbi:MAG: hypothetical protein MUF65_08555, partial [Rubritepida sp.]|nr:hypothetical protein [Rubritepida sp.]
FTLFGLGFADFRLPIVIAVVLVAGTTWRGLSPRAALLVAAAFAGITLLRVGVMTQEWERGNARYAAIMDVMGAMEPGRKMLAVMAREDATARFQRRPPLDHAASFAIITRQAFVPSFFAESEKQPVNFAPEVAALGVHPPWSFALRDEGGRRALAAAAAPYDYLLLFASAPPADATPRGARRMDDGSVPGVALFDLRPAR